MLKVAQSRSSEFSDGWRFRICAPCHGRQLLGVSVSSDEEVNRVCEGFQASAHVAGTALSKHIFIKTVCKAMAAYLPPHIISSRNAARGRAKLLQK